MIFLIVTSVPVTLNREFLLVMYLNRNFLPFDLIKWRKFTVEYN